MHTFLNKPYRSAAVALWMASSLGAVFAQPAAAQASAQVTTFRISGFEVTGDIPLDAAETSRILAPYLGPKGSVGTLQEATAALEAALHAKGFALHRVSLPAQDLGDSVKLNVVKFVIGTVTVEGNSAFSLSNVRASVPELREGASPNFKAMAVQTAIANENPAKQVSVSLKESQEPDKIDATIVVKETSPFYGSIGLSNTGSAATGNDRLAVSLGHANVWERDHQFSAAYTTSMERPDDVKQLGLNYRIPLYQQSAVVGMSYTNSDVVGSFGNFKSTGAGQTYGVNVNLYLPPNGGYRAYGSLALDEKLFNASKIDTGGVVTVVQADRTSRPLTLGYSGRKESDTAYWGYGVDLALNLPGGPGNNLTAYQTEDARIMTDRWTALHANLQYLAPLARGWLWSTRLQLQYSADALIAGEQFGLGGATSVRGSSERAVSGDSGLGASFEVTSPEVVQGLRLVGFWDGGWLRNNNAAASTVKAANDQLASVGLGARYALGTFNLTAEWGRVVTGATEPLTVVTGLPKVGDEKLHVNMTVRF